MVPANRLNRVGLQLSPDGEQAFIHKLFPFQNEGPGATNLLRLTGLGDRCQAYPKPPPSRTEDSIFGPKKGKADCVVGPKKRKADCVVRPCAEGSAPTVPGCRQGLLVKWRPRSWCAAELLKAPALLGGEGRPLLLHCIVTRESGSLAGCRTVSWLLAVDERLWFERLTMNCVPTRQGASLVRESRTRVVDASLRLAGCSC